VPVLSEQLALVAPARSTQLHSQGVRLLPVAGQQATWQVGLAFEPTVWQRFVALARESFEENGLPAP
jgi:hypothetical protein